MSVDRTALDTLCRECGIASEYADIWGQVHAVPDASRIALLQAMGVINDDADLPAALLRRETQAWRVVMPGACVVRQAVLPYRMELRLPRAAAGRTFQWTLTLESGETHEGRFRPEQLTELQHHELPDGIHVGFAFDWHQTLPLGYHHYTLKSDDGSRPAASTLLIVAPQRCHLPAGLQDEGRLWGPTLQLYSLRSRRNWGMGDFTDLATAVEQWGTRGAGITGLNPLHALFPHNPLHTSPYSPSSRDFLNVLYIDVAAVAAAEDCADATDIIHSAGFRARLQALRDSALVDHAAVAHSKLHLLERLYAHFRERHLGPGTARGAAFRVFQAEQGQALRRHALFHALQEHFFAADTAVWGWPVWPAAYRHPAAPAVAQFAQECAERVEFHEYLQWQADVQLGRAQEKARALGMAIGLYRDLAISVDRGGADAWAHQELYALDASVGAPPDLINLSGQNWGLPPLRPDALRAAAYQPFIATLRANMRHAGALRIDHVMGLARLFCIPPGATGADGTYVRFPFEDMLGILALESQRNRCVVIGEDLGTVSDEVREGLQRTGVFSYRLLYFERDHNASFKLPAAYPADALVAASTHDLPTLAGYWEGRDLALRDELGLFPDLAQRDAQRAARLDDHRRLLAALEHEGLLPAGLSVTDPPGNMTPDLALALHTLLARAPARVLVVQLEDVLELRDQANLPGTTHEHPNWKRKLPLDLEDFATDKRLEQFAGMLAVVRGRSQPPASAIPVQPRIPRATYRLQLHRDFSFAAATALVPYLAELGISHVYCSPYLKARPGSAHGYDIVDHSQLNPEIGTRQELELLCETLRHHGMGQILDVVPNHMAVMRADNNWWLDVLENGPVSAYAGYFDIDWMPVDAELAQRVLVPVLGEHYGIALENGDLKLIFDGSAGTFAVTYHEHRFPLDPRTYPQILRGVIETLGPASLQPAELAEFASLVDAFDQLPARHELATDRLAARRRDKDLHRQRLAQLVRGGPALTEAIERMLHLLNGIPGEAASFSALHDILEAQAYRLAYWRVASDDINYRRFFDINDLAALRMEDPQVFAETHRLVFDLLAQGKVDGLRIDHPDGLHDPARYFRELQEHYVRVTGGALPAPADGRPARPLYVLIEKITAGHEHVPTDWAVHGTTGYRFATVVNGLFVDGDAERDILRTYRGFVHDRTGFEETAYRGRRTIMQAALASELTVLATQLLRIARADRRTRDYTLNTLRRALMEVAACFPVYRTYISDTASASDRRHIDWAVARARRRSSAADITVFEFVRRTLLAETLPDTAAPLESKIRTFAMRFQQFTAPVAAKGVEDTAFYRYHPLAMLNEVGGDPEMFGFPVSAFHGASSERALNWPHTLLATSTHDNKRSEDVRTRIAVLSEMPDAWRTLLRRWARINRSRKQTVNGEAAPSRNDEYLLYQTLLGTFPAPAPDAAGLAEYHARIAEYMLKAVREAKLRTSWINPDADYEKALTDFVASLLGRQTGNLFLDDLISQSRTTAWFGALNSLSMVLIKLASPGVPDIYQGNELLDYSMVDPDNRRPVDYACRHDLLVQLQACAAAPDTAQQLRTLSENLTDGRAKLWLTWRMLQHRRACSELFEQGNYVALPATGQRSGHVLAFARRHGNQCAIAVAGRLWAKLDVEAGRLPLTREVWGDTAIDLSPLSLHEGPVTAQDQVSGEAVVLTGNRLLLCDAFAHFPGALIHLQR